MARRAVVTWRGDANASSSPWYRWARTLTSSGWRWGALARIVDESARGGGRDRAAVFSLEGRVSRRPNERWQDGRQTADFAVLG